MIVQTHLVMGAFGASGFFNLHEAGSFLCFFLDLSLYHVRISPPTSQSSPNRLVSCHLNEFQLSLLNLRSQLETWGSRSGVRFAHPNSSGRSLAPPLPWPLIAWHSHTANVRRFGPSASRGATFSCTLTSDYREHLMSNCKVLHVSLNVSHDSQTQ